MRIDLHTHTTASDGLLSAEALIALARDVGVGILAVADHDSTDSVDAAIAAGGQASIEIIPAVEINTDVDAGEVHVLGYFIDHHQPWFQEFLQRMRDGRVHRALRMVEKLNALGIPIEMKQVQELAQGAVGRPHIAMALVRAGAVKTAEEAFARFIGRHGPAYVERMKVTPAEAIEIILRAGGIPVLAHPGWGVRDEMILALVHDGLEGLEAYYPDHTPAMTARYVHIAREHALLVTGGTDFHGGDLATKVPPGGQYVPDEVVDRLKARYAEKRRQ